MEKRIITLETGQVVDCGANEFDDMVEAIKEGDSKKIVLATVNVLQSSDVLMDELVEAIGEAFSKAIEDDKGDQKVL